MSMAFLARVSALAERVAAIERALELQREQIAQLVRRLDEIDLPPLERALREHQAARAGSRRA